jgi:hypothetical protein
VTLHVLIFHNFYLGFDSFDVQEDGVLCLLVVTLHVVFAKAEKRSQADEKSIIAFLQNQMANLAAANFHNKFKTYWCIERKHALLTEDIVVSSWNLYLVAKFVENIHYFPSKFNKIYFCKNFTIVVVSFFSALNDFEK